MADEDMETLLHRHLEQRPGWATAREIAVEIGHPWRVVARALLRMSDRDQVEIDEIEWISNRYRIRKCRIYRVAVGASGCDISMFPAWMMMPRGDSSVCA